MHSSSCSARSFPFHLSLPSSPLPRRTAAPFLCFPNNRPVKDPPLSFLDYHAGNFLTPGSFISFFLPPTARGGSSLSFFPLEPSKACPRRHHFLRDGFPPLAVFFVRSGLRCPIHSPFDRIADFCDPPFSFFSFRSLTAFMLFVIFP